MLNKWRARRTGRAASTSSAAAPPAAPVKRGPALETPVETPAGDSPEHGNLWATEDIDVGITNIVVGPPGSTDGVLFEISARFPQAGRLWRVQRSVAEFAALHAAIETQAAAALYERDIHLPRASRMSWSDLRSKSYAPTDDPAAQQMLLKLNAYLRKLLELQEIVDDASFREFLTPRPTSPGDVEVRGSMLPTLAIQPTTSVISELHTMKLLASLTSNALSDTRAPPPPVESQCTQKIHFGSSIQLRALGGLRIGLTKRGGLSGSQKAVAVAAGVAGMALTGPLSAALALGALGGGVGKYQLNKSFYLTVNKAKNTAKSGYLNARAASASTGKNGNGYFIVENADLVSGPRRPLKFGDLFHLYCRNVRKSVRIAAPPDSKHGHLMVTNAETKRATLRLVSPNGDRDRGATVVCGSHVYLQVLNGTWAGQYLSLQGEFLATGNSPTVFKICQQDHACHASEETIAIPKAVAPRAPFKLRVMVYNVWLFPSILTTVNDKLCPSAMQRAQAIPKAIGPLGVDVVVFCEAFCATAREVLVKGMKEQGFLFETKVVGEGASVSNKKAIDGGCFAMSRYPLEHFEELTFGAAAVGDDRMADKGAIYFQVRVGDHEIVHVFGTHLQAWESKVAVAARLTQLRSLRDFIDSKKISPLDAVLVAGDLNVDACGEQSRSEYETMLELLLAQDPPLKDSSSKFSFDPLTNQLAVGGLSSGGRTERLDYVLTARHHRVPTESSAEIVRLKATKEWTLPTGSEGEELVDLSDHYPVVCELQY
jgi:endonuclease/exonuclease/phosphatase family metal-dependent hydrolase